MTAQRPFFYLSWALTWTGTWPRSCQLVQIMVIYQSFDKQVVGESMGGQIFLKGAARFDLFFLFCFFPKLDIFVFIRKEIS